METPARGSVVPPAPVTSVSLSSVSPSVTTTASTSATSSTTAKSTPLGGCLAMASSWRRYCSASCSFFRSWCRYSWALLLASWSCCCSSSRSVPSYKSKPCHHWKQHSITDYPERRQKVKTGSGLSSYGFRILPSLLSALLKTLPCFPPRCLSSLRFLVS